MDPISEKVKQQILNRKCQAHGRNSSQRRMCLSCAQNIPSHQVIDIQDIINFKPSQKYQIFEQISSMQTEMKTQEKNMNTQIKRFFQKFYKDLQESITRIMNQQKLYLDFILKMNEETDSLAIVKVKDIQKILIGQKINEDQELEQCIQQWYSKEEKNNLEKIQKIQSTFLILSAEKVAEDVLRLIDLINFFPNDSKLNIQQTAPIPFQVQQSQHQQPQSIQFEKDSPFQTQQKNNQQLQHFQFENKQPTLIQQKSEPYPTQFGSIFPPNFHKPQPIQFENNSPFYAQQQQPLQFSSFQFENYQIQTQQKQTQASQPIQFESQIQQKQIQKSQSNEFEKAQPFQAQKFTQQLMPDFNQPSQTQSKNQSQPFQTNNKFQKNQIQKNHFQIPHQQKTSQTIALKSQFQNCQSQEIHQKLNQQPQLNEIEKQMNLLSKISFVPFQGKNNLQIQFNKSNNQVTILNTAQEMQQCYFDQLLQQKSNYVIQLTYNHLKDGYALFCFGLITQKYKNTCLKSDCDNIYFHQRTGGFTNKIVKGNYLQSEEEKASGQHLYEIHINIAKKIFRICTIDYKNCQELDSNEYFYQGNEYYFAIKIGNIEDKAIIHKIQEVDQLPSINK